MDGIEATVVKYEAEEPDDLGTAKEGEEETEEEGEEEKEKAETEGKKGKEKNGVLGEQIPDTPCQGVLFWN